MFKDSWSRYPEFVCVCVRVTLEAAQSIQPLAHGSTLIRTKPSTKLGSFSWNTTTTVISYIIFIIIKTENQRPSCPSCPVLFATYCQFGEDVCSGSNADTNHALYADDVTQIHIRVCCLSENYPSCTWLNRRRQTYWSWVMTDGSISASSSMLGYWYLHTQSCLHHFRGHHTHLGTE